MIYFGLLFFGLYLLETSVSPHNKDGQISNWVAQTNNPIKRAVVGGLATLIIQSSSATVGMLIILAKQQLIGLSGAVASTLGAELGT